LWPDAAAREDPADRFEDGKREEKEIGERRKAAIIADAKVKDAESISRP
jgi:hypothetical protein